MAHITLSRKWSSNSSFSVAKKTMDTILTIKGTTPMHRRTRRLIRFLSLHIQRWQHIIFFFCCLNSTKRTQNNTDLASLKIVLLWDSPVTHLWSPLRAVSGCRIVHHLCWLRQDCLRAAYCPPFHRVTLFFNTTANQNVWKKGLLSPKKYNIIEYCMPRLVLTGLLFFGPFFCSVTGQLHITFGTVDTPPSFPTLVT